MTGPPIKRLYYSLAEVSRKTHLPSHVIKAWSDTYGRIHPTKGKNGRLLYRPRDVDLLHRIKEWQQCGYSDETIRDLIRNPRPGDGHEETAPADRPEASDTLIRHLTAGLEEIISILEGR